MKRIALAACVVLALMLAAVPAQAKTRKPICVKINGQRYCLVVPPVLGDPQVIFNAAHVTIHDGAGWVY